MTYAWVATGVVWWGAYEVLRRRSTTLLRPWRRACWAAAGALLVLAGAPPLGSAAASQEWAAALQFALLAFGVAPLAALGGPGAVGSRRRSAAGVSARLTSGRGWPALALFFAATVGWRLPVAVNAAAAHRWLVLVEAATLVIATLPLWAALSGSPPAPALSQRPRRMALAALAVWSVWIFAYVVGFSSRPFYSGYAGRGGMDSQEFGVVIIFAVSALALVPVVFLNLVRWLASEDVLGEASAALHPRRVPSGGDRWVGGSSGA